ncbi:MAG: hypothetical protein N2170_09620, partial [Bacteroidia bacterium]|nr:hypothetical protein [Bacteroidia bacterium]
GRLSWEAFLAAIERGDRKWGVYVAPPQGLFLWRVRYPESCLSLLESYGFLRPSDRAVAAAAPAPESPPDSAGAPAGGPNGGTG